MNRRLLLRFAPVAWLQGACASALSDNWQTTRSSDGLWQLTADPQVRRLLLQDSQGNTVRSFDLPTPSPLATGTVVQTPLVLQTHARRQSFVVAFGACSELWEISYNPRAEEIFDGLVHDYRNHEGLARPGFLGVRRTPLDQPLDDLLIDTESPHVLGRARWHQADVQVVNLDIRKVRARFPLPLANQLALASFKTSNARRLLHVPAPDGVPDRLDICIDTLAWQAVPCPDGCRQ